MMTAQRLVAWGDELRDVHQRLRRALAVARESVDGGLDEARPASTDLLLFCRGFCAALSGHHSAEDGALFPEIVAARPDLAPVIAKLTQDHSMIEYLISGLEASLRTGGSPEELHQHLDGIEAVMETHFRYEERQLVTVLNSIDLGDRDRSGVFGPLA
jgi:hemerythrin-like domain-containing protein